MELTEEARAALKQALEDFNQPGAGIHLFNSQGCFGPKINLEISTQPGPNETKVILEDVDFFIDNSLLPSLQDVTFLHTGRGFIMNHLTNTGGCCK